MRLFLLQNSGWEPPLRLVGCENSFGNTHSGAGNGNPLQYSCLENSTDREAWQAIVHGVPKSQTQLSKRAHIHTHSATKGRLLHGTWIIFWVTSTCCSLSGFYTEPCQAQALRDPSLCWRYFSLFYSLFFVLFARCGWYPASREHLNMGTFWNSLETDLTTEYLFRFRYEQE